MTTIGLVSDTHGRLDAGIVGVLLGAGVNHIIHAGDICGSNILHELEQIAPVTAVLGNNDFDEYGPNVGRFAHPVIDGVRFLVAHKPNDVRIGFNGCAGLSAGDPIPQILVHGHTHMPRLEWGEAAYPANYIMNPGAAFRPRSDFGRTLGFIEVEDGRVKNIRIENLSGRVVMTLPN